MSVLKTERVIPEILIITAIVFFCLYVMRAYVKYVGIDKSNNIYITYFVLIFHFRTYCVSIDKVDIYFGRNYIKILSIEDNKLHVIERGTDCGARTFCALLTHIQELIECKEKDKGSKKNRES